MSGHVAIELLGSEDLLKNGAKLVLRPGAADFDVGQHVLEVTHPGRKALHLAEAFVYGVELFTDQLERFTQTFFERAL